MYKGDELQKTLHKEDILPKDKWSACPDTVWRRTGGFAILPLLGVIYRLPNCFMCIQGSRCCETISRYNLCPIDESIPCVRFFPLRLGNACRVSLFKLADRMSDPSWPSSGLMPGFSTAEEPVRPEVAGHQACSRSSTRHMNHLTRDIA